MALTPYLNDPLFSQIERAMDRAMGRFLGDRGTDISFMPSFTRDVGMPSMAHPMDIVETNDAYELTADAPGFTPADITVQMHDGTLTISGKRQEEKEEKAEGDRVIRRERHFSQFSRSFTLPENIKEDEISANLDKGVLKVRVPKVEPPPKPEPKRITVQGA